jgi:hypothetical protein
MSGFEEAIPSVPSSKGATKSQKKASRSVLAEQHAAMSNSKRTTLSTTMYGGPATTLRTVKQMRVIQQDQLNPDASTADTPSSVDSDFISDDFDGAARQLIIEAGEATLPLSSSTELETESTMPTHATPSDSDAPADKRRQCPSVPDRTASRVRRSTANYSANYTPLPLDLSDHESAEDTSSFELSDDNEEAESDDEEEAEVPSSDEVASGQEDDGKLVLSDMDIEPEPTVKRKSQLATSSRSTRKGVDYSLPPMFDNETIFADLTSRAVEMGLANRLKKLDRPINVATMCSGTESPLFGLIASATALETKTEPQPPLKIRHVFSAEIEPFKQAFIERNWAPELLFRDIREFITEGATTATTAYGSIEAIPQGVDMLVAGFSCRNLSRQNNYQKSLKESGESGETWMAVYEYSKRFRPRVVLLENVKSKASTWDDLVAQWSDIGYEAGWLYCDTKRYYLPQTRERMYMIAVERRNSGKEVSQAVHDWKQAMRDLERPCSSPYEAFLAHFPRGSVDYNTLTSEWAWELCKLRYDHMRSELRLGIKRPCTKWSENGTKQ